MGEVVQEAPSDPASFPPRNTTTSEADALGGAGNGMVWGTTVSIEDSFASFRDFLKNFTKKYQMYRDGMTDEQIRAAPEAQSRIYMDALETMLALGTTRLYLNLSDLKLYPPTRKLYHQLILYPQEIVPVMDQSVKDCILQLAERESLAERASQGTPGRNQMPASQDSAPAFPSSDRPDSTPTARMGPSIEDQVDKTTYVVRPFGMEKPTNLRELNPSGKWKHFDRARGAVS